MAERTPLFDRRRFRAKLDRANRMEIAGADILLQRAAEEIAARLAVTNRTFRHAADILSVGDHVVAELSKADPGIRIERIGLAEPGKNATADAVLGIEPQSLDLVVSLMGLHRCNDLPEVFRQIFSALKPDGLFMAAIPGEGTLTELRQSLIEAETQLTGGAALRVDPFAEMRQIGSLLQSAGFALPVVDLDCVKLRYASLDGLLADIRANGAGASFAGKARTLPHGTLEILENVYRKNFSDPDGKIRASANIIQITAWTPHESQQQPLKPGAAQFSLAKALKSGGGSGSG